MLGVSIVKHSLAPFVDAGSLLKIALAESASSLKSLMKKQKKALSYLRSKLKTPRLYEKQAPGVAKAFKRSRHAVVVRQIID